MTDEDYWLIQMSLLTTDDIDDIAYSWHCQITERLIHLIQPCCRLIITMIIDIAHSTLLMMIYDSFIADSLHLITDS